MLFNAYMICFADICLILRSISLLCEFQLNLLNLNNIVDKVLEPKRLEVEPGTVNASALVQNVHLLPFCFNGGRDIVR